MTEHRGALLDALHAIEDAANERLDHFIISDAEQDVLWAIRRIARAAIAKAEPPPEDR